MPKIGVIQTKNCMFDCVWRGVCVCVGGGGGWLGSQGTDNFFTTKFKFWALLSIMKVQWTLYTTTAFVAKYFNVELNLLLHL